MHFLLHFPLIWIHFQNCLKKIKAPNFEKKIARNLPHVVHAYNPAALGTILFFLSALHVIITSH